MSLSYIKPRKKKPISDELWLVVIFFFMTLTILFLTFGFLKLKTHGFESKSLSIKQSKSKLITNIALLNQKIDLINFEVSKTQAIKTQNTVLQDSIKNLFDLIPDRIVLSQVNITKNSLILYGMTPNKNIYNFMLQAPLSSIFSKTKTSFYQLPNGSLKFVCKNYINGDNR